MFCLGPYKYKDKESLKEKIKSYLKNANDGIISNPEIIDKLRYLVLMHPEAERKIGAGIKCFKVERNYLGSGKGFVIICEDGTEERFSYKTCIDGKIPSHINLVVEGFRFSIRDQMAIFRRSVVLPTRCSISNQIIAIHEDLHIDHKIPFSVLLSKFCKQYSISLMQINIVGNGEFLEIHPEEIKIQFQEFHRQNAILQPSLKNKNLEKSNL